MTTADHVKSVTTFYAAFEAGNPDMLTEHVTDTFTIGIPEMDFLPLASKYVGVEGFATLLRDRQAGQIHYDRFDKSAPIAQEDVVVVIGRTAGRALAQGRPFAHEWVHVFRFDEGRIASFKEYIDSSSVSAAFAP